MNLSEFSWEVACPAPWGNSALVYFDFPDPRVYLAVPARFQLPTARLLSQFLRNFSLIERYCGMRNTISRIMQLYVERGDNMEESWLKSLLAVHMTVYGTNAMTTPFLYHYAQFLRQKTSADFMDCDVSSLHGWALHESADYFLRDLLPQLEQQGGSPFEKAAELADQAQAVRAHFRQIADFFSGEASPYFHMSELPIMEKSEGPEIPPPLD